MTNQQLTIRDDMPLSELGNVLAKSGFFADTREAGQAIVKVLAGREMGFGPIASMTGINIIKGRVSLSANLMASAVKRSGRYDYKVIENSVTACEISFHENSKETGRSRFTMEDARKAGTQNLDKFPRNMLFARAMSNGVRWYCPDVTNGPAYTPEELGATVDEEGEVVTGTATEVTTPAPVVEAPKTNGKHAQDISAYRDRYQLYANTAAQIGVPFEPMNLDWTVEEISEKGKTLKAAVAAASEPA